MAIFKSLFGKPAPKAARIPASGLEFSVQPDETILERALKDGFAYPHDCTVGTCGTCRTRLIAGKVDAITPFGYTLSRDEIEAGYILACQALPKTDVTLEVELGGADDINTVTPARIVETRPLTHDILSVTWETERPIAFRAGQYANIRWNGGTVQRSYSFAMAPQAGGSTRITSFVRHVPGGTFTDALFDGSAADFSYELDGPHGAFWLRPGKGPILCIAGGSGLAPLLSLLSDAAAKRARRDCVLLFGARGQRDIYCEKDISAIRNAWTAGFDYWPVLSEETVPGMRLGMVTSHIKTALDRLGPDAQAYMCGPPAMIDAAIAELAAQGVSLSEIFYDKFTDASTAAG